METVLITGGTGLIGKHLTSLLQYKGYDVIYLSRTVPGKSEIPVFSWDVEKKTIAAAAIEKADYIIHLAGAGIADKKWTAKRKREILHSRIDSTALLRDAIQHSNKKIKAFVSASAIGFYGAVTSDKVFSEEDPPATDFIGTTCRLWEQSVETITALGIRTVIIRTGIVLASNAASLKKIILPVKLGIGSPLGKGRQYMPWIHIDDICALYLKAIEDINMAGVYNGVAPEHITNAFFMKTIADTLQKPFLLPRVPAFVLKLMFGEMAVILLEGSKVSAAKTAAAGFKFKYTSVKNALAQLIQ